jgi:hypothetical protein
MIMRKRNREAEAAEVRTRKRTTAIRERQKRIVEGSCVGS